MCACDCTLLMKWNDLCETVCASGQYIHCLPPHVLRPVYGVFRAALSPSSALDGIPNQIATFDADVYNQGIVQTDRCGVGVLWHIRMWWCVCVYYICGGVVVWWCVCMYVVVHVQYMTM